MKVYAIDVDVLYPRTDAERFRLYARRGSDLQVLATTDTAGGIGEAIVQIDADQAEIGQQLGDLGALGVLDAVAGRWIVSPWHRSERKSP